MWLFDGERETHRVLLFHSFWSHETAVYVDDVVMVSAMPMDNFSHKYTFTHDQRHCEVLIGRSYWALAVTYTLKVDGRIIDPVNLVEAKAETKLLRASEEGSNRDLLKPAGAPCHESDSLPRASNNE